jgi:hypothetical protein
MTTLEELDELYSLLSMAEVASAIATARWRECSVDKADNWNDLFEKHNRLKEAANHRREAYIEGYRDAMRGGFMK